jgi:hypothetical protein
MMNYLFSSQSTLAGRGRDEGHKTLKLFEVEGTFPTQEISHWGLIDVFLSTSIGRSVINRRDLSSSSRRRRH